MNIRKVRKDRKKRVKIILFTIGIWLGVVGTGNIAIYAEAAQLTESVEATSQISALSQVMTAQETVDMKKEADASSETLMTYENGASVFVTGQTQDGWYQVFYQGMTGYVPEEALCVQEIDIAKLNEEMDDNAKEAEFIAETVEKYHREEVYDKIWFGMIVVIVAAIFAVGIISGKKKKDTKADGR